jgi:flagellar motility protein MotE (MotC chaperone)
MDSVVAPNVVSSDRFLGSSKLHSLGLVLAIGFLGFKLAQDSRGYFAGFIGGSACDGRHRHGGTVMQLKMWVLTGAAIALWLAPLVALDKRIGWHKSMQGLSLCGAVACAIGGGNIARKLADEAEIEALKLRAVKADVEDEIATEVYVSQKVRQQEAEAILASPGEDMEEVRERLEALYKPESEEVEVTLATTTDASLELAKSLYTEVVAAREAGKANTWIIENIFKMKGRKFSEGKVKLQSLLNQFEGE